MKEFFQLRELTPQENNARVMGIFERQIRMQPIIGESLSSLNQQEVGVAPQDMLDGINLARRLSRTTLFQTSGDIYRDGDETQQQMAHLDIQLNRARVTHPPVTVFDAKALGEGLAKFVQEYQGNNYEQEYIQPHNRKSDW